MTLAHNQSEATAVIRDQASNDDENAVAEVVRRHYASAAHAAGRARAAPAEQHTAFESVQQAPTAGAQAPVIRQHRSQQVPSFQALQEWEGVVSGVTPTTMIADLVDVTAGGNLATEQVEIDLEELSHEDRENLRIGAVFRWAIGYVTKPGTPKQRISQIVFRQMPVWSRADLDAADHRAAERHRAIRWE